ncbi:cupin-like domain-containing protein [uncultured Gilvimarinus sp.]|uniref:cupin-like domain-containing protein n=1 Tax=uncultured Gilvimarinus sp. TaxID=1689143 RepID=UPI0030ED877E|tara:strand:- start:622 stop:1638 length:1017 start_codon:yes stop_codon:yes gene_type:complete
MTAYKQIPEYKNIPEEQFFNEIVPAQKPIVIRDFAKHWPIVDAAKSGPNEFVGYLNRFYAGGKANIALGHPCINGRFFYTDDMQGVNFIRGDERLDLFLFRLLELAEKEVYPAVSIQNISLSDILPGLNNENKSSFFPDVEPRLWLGNEGTVSTHYDGSDNVACVIAGRRRFTLFPPEQTANLYPGSLNFTPAGAPVSLVNVHDPDLDRYPRFRTALNHAYSAELGPGDAIFMPMLWWHNVDSLAKVNGLMNYWWTGSGAKDAASPTPIDSLSMAILAMRKLTPAQRNSWRYLFDHYLFKQGVDPVSYIPEPCQHVLGELSPEDERSIKDYLIEKLQQ